MCIEGTFVTLGALSPFRLNKITRKNRGKCDSWNTGRRNIMYRRCEPPNPECFWRFSNWTNRSHASSFMVVRIKNHNLANQPHKRQQMWILLKCLSRAYTGSTALGNCLMRPYSSIFWFGKLMGNTVTFNKAACMMHDCCDIDLDYSLMNLQH